MSIEAILQALDTEAERQISEIQQSARAEVERILDEAQRRAAAVRQEHAAALRPALRAEQARILNQARLGAMQVILGTRQELLDAVRRAAESEIAALAGGEAYAGVMRRLIQEAAERLGSEMRLQTRECDVELAQAIARDLGLRATIEKSEDHCIGGVSACDPAGRITLTNTLDTRLERSLDRHRPEIAEILFQDASGE